MCERNILNSNGNRAVSKLAGAELKRPQNTKRKKKTKIYISRVAHHHAGHHRHHQNYAEEEYSRQLSKVYPKGEFDGN